MAERIGVSGRFQPFALPSPRAVEADILAELRSHLELATSENVEAGMDPESARRSADERFGDFGEVFGACRAEKLKDRIMLQRILLTLVLVLAAAVVVQAYQLHEGQQETGRAIREMREDVAAMTLRIEDRFDAALFLGGRGGRDAPPTGSALAPGSGDPPNAGAGSTPTPYRGPLRERIRTDVDDLLQIQATLDDLKRRQSQLKPSHTKWNELKREIEDRERRLRELQSLTLWNEFKDEEDRLRELPPGERRGLQELTSLLRDPSTDAGKRFEAVHSLGEIATTWRGHGETPLRKGDRVLVEDNHQPPLCFSAVVDEQGNLLVPVLGFVAVEGRTRGEVEVLLQRQLEAYFVQVDLQVSKEAWDFDVLLEALADPDTFVRHAAAQILGQIGDHRARRALRHAAEHDPEQAVREAAATALGSFR